MIEVTAAEMNAALAAEMPERELQSKVEALLKLYGWRYFHTHRSDRSQPGFPDLCAVRPPRLLFAELKRQTTKLTDAQRGWYDDLTAARALRCDCGTETYSGGGECPEIYLWRPVQLVDGTIARTLA